MELRSARTRIRPWTLHDDDLADEWPAYNDPLEPLWNLPRQFGLGGDSWAHSFDSISSRRTWAVEDRIGRLIGRISLREIDERKGQARLGITFGAPYVSQGLGTESLAVFLDYYFRDLGYLSMVLDVAAPNQRAVRSYERLGFRYVSSDWREAGSRFDRSILERREYADIRRFFFPHQRGLQVEFFEMQLLKEEWLAHRQNERAR
jgi:RimJ/RimL family protein N-acetyltransferase